MDAKSTSQWAGRHWPHRPRWRGWPLFHASRSKGAHICTISFTLVLPQLMHLPIARDLVKEQWYSTPWPPVMPKVCQCVMLTQTWRSFDFDLERPSTLNTMKIRRPVYSRDETREKVFVMIIFNFRLWPFYHGRWSSAGYRARSVLISDSRELST